MGGIWYVWEDEIIIINYFLIWFWWVHWAPNSLRTLVGGALTLYFYPLPYASPAFIFSLKKQLTKILWKLWFDFGIWIPCSEMVTAGEFQPSILFMLFIYFVSFKFGPLKLVNVWLYSQSDCTQSISLILCLEGFVILTWSNFFIVPLPTSLLLSLYLFIYFYKRGTIN
jgi:hypothetical protein